MTENRLIKRIAFFAQRMEVTKVARILPKVSEFIREQETFGEKRNGN